MIMLGKVLGVLLVVVALLGLFAAMTAIMFVEIYQSYEEDKKKDNKVEEEN